MIKNENYKTFNGAMEITPVCGEAFILSGDWLYKPEYGCWYGCGQSFPAEICKEG